MPTLQPLPGMPAGMIGVAELRGSLSSGLFARSRAECAGGQRGRGDYRRALGPGGNVGCRVVESPIAVTGGRGCRRFTSRRLEWRGRVRRPAAGLVRAVDDRSTVS